MADYDYALTDFSGFVDFYTLREAVTDIVSITLTPCVLRFSFADYIETNQQAALDDLVRTHEHNQQQCADFALTQTPLLMWSEFLAGRTFPIDGIQRTFFDSICVSDLHVATYTITGELQQIIDGTHTLAFEFVDGSLSAVTLTETV